MPQLILVVDDEPKVARLARDYLEKNGFRVLTAGDGQSALTTACRWLIWLPMLAFEVALSLRLLIWDATVLETNTTR